MQHANKDRSLRKDDIQGAKKRKAMDVENIDDEKDDEQVVMKTCFLNFC